MLRWNCDSLLGNIFSREVKFLSSFPDCGTLGLHSWTLLQGVLILKDTLCLIRFRFPMNAPYLDQWKLR